LTGGYGKGPTDWDRSRNKQRQDVEAAAAGTLAGVDEAGKQTVNEAATGGFLFGIGQAIKNGWRLCKLGWRLGRGAAAAAGAAGAVGSSAGAVMDAMGRPTWAKDKAGGFVNWLCSLQKRGNNNLTKEQADAIIEEANRLGVNVRLDPPHPQYPRPHLNVGKDGQAHLNVPEGYDHPTVPKGSATRPRR